MAEEKDHSMGTPEQYTRDWYLEELEKAKGFLKRAKDTLRSAEVNVYEFCDFPDTLDGQFSELEFSLDKIVRNLMDPSYKPKRT